MSLPNSESVRLEWSAPIPAERFLTEDIPVRYKSYTDGVYIWRECRPDRLEITYVGKSNQKTLIQRQQEHLSNYIGLRCTLPARARACGQEWVPNFYPGNADTLLVAEKATALMREAIAYIKRLEVFLAPTPTALADGKPNSVLLKRIERTLLWELQPTGTSWGTKSPPGEPVEIEHESEQWTARKSTAAFKKALLSM